MNTEQLDLLEALHRRATQGEWFVDDNCIVDEQGRIVARSPRLSDKSAPGQRDDAEYIVFLNNWALDMLAAARELEQTKAKLDLSRIRCQRCWDEGKRRPHDVDWQSKRDEIEPDWDARAECPKGGQTEIGCTGEYQWNCGCDLAACECDKGQLFALRAENERLRAEVEAAHALIDAHQKALVPLYTSGYMRGHHDTVEGGFVVVHLSDEPKYFAGDVDEWLRERSALAPTPEGSR